MALPPPPLQTCFFSYLLLAWPYLDPKLQWIEVACHTMQLGIYLAAAAVMTTKAGSAAEAASWAATGGRPLQPEP